MGGQLIVEHVFYLFHSKSVYLSQWAGTLFPLSAVDQKEGLIDVGEKI